MTQRTFLINAFDLLVLGCLAIAQPVFDLLSRNVEFLAARNSDAIDILILAAAATFLIPGLLIILEIIAGMIGARAFNYIHRFLVWGFLVLLFLPPAKPLYRIVGNGYFLIIVVLAGILSETYIRLRSRGLALAYLSPVVLILPALFLFHSPARLIFQSPEMHASNYPKVKATAPVVMIMFDEFPLTSLMNDRGEINSLRYPNFAKLAASSTWYRNASTSAADTLHVIPTVLDGQLPDLNRKLLPRAEDHPNNLFTLLGGSYHLNVVENNTRLCPDDLCGSPANEMSRFQALTSLASDMGVLYLYVLLPADHTRALPDITQSWKEFSAARAKARRPMEKADDFFKGVIWDERPQEFARFVESIRPEPKPSLNYLHILLPHAPWEFLPSGKQHTRSLSAMRGLMGINDQGIDAQLWLDDPWAIQQAYRKHLLQVEMVDRLLGKLVDHLKEIKLYDPSLFVVMADHGASFRSNESRRAPSEDNYADIMAIPLFIKRPNQNKGEINDSNIESVDILPTIADILGIHVPWKMDGRSALDPAAPPKAKKVIVPENGKKLVVDAALDGLHKSIKEKIATFGYTPDDLFHIGRHKELINQNIKDLAVTKSPVKYILDERDYLEDMDLNSRYIPANIHGRLIGNRRQLALPLDLALSVNNKIVGVTEAYSDSKNAIRFSLVVSDSYFRPGYNNVQVYLISGNGNHLEVMESEGGKRIPPYRWGDVLRFGSDGNAKPYQTRGWSGPEGQFTWTEARRAELVLPAPAPRREISLKFEASPYLKPGKLNSQRVILRINHQIVANWVLTSGDLQTREIMIPPEVFDSDKTVLTFELPDAISPSAIGEGPDLRQVGLAMVSLSLSEN